MNKFKGKTNILMVGTSFKTKGGISAVVKELLEAKAIKNKCNVRYICTHMDGSYRLKFKYIIEGYAKYFFFLIFGKQEIIHIHVASRASFYRKAPLFLIASFFKLKTVCHHHGGEFMIFYREECGPVKKKYIRWVLSRASVILVLSEEWARKFYEISSKLNVKVLPNGIKVPRKHNSVYKNKIHQILFMGRIGKQKGVHDLICAAGLLVERGLEFKIVLCGDGDLSTWSKECSRKKLNNVMVFKGWVSGIEKETLYRQSDIYVLPSYNEGLPMSVLEAISHGLPVVATPVGGVPDAVQNGVNGYLVEPGDVNELAEKITAIIIDRKLREKFSYASKKISETKFDITQISKQLYGIYQQTLYG